MLPCLALPRREPCRTATIRWASPGLNSWNSRPGPGAVANAIRATWLYQVARHVSKDVTLFRQGSMNFLINADDDSFAARFAVNHGVGIFAIGLRVFDAEIFARTCR